MTQIPSPASQIQFLTNLQRLLDEGIFTASYKYALLMSLADISVESVHPDVPQVVHVQEIARTFLEYYWRQAAPYFGNKYRLALNSCFKIGIAVRAQRSSVWLLNCGNTPMDRLRPLVAIQNYGNHMLGR